MPADRIIQLRELLLEKFPTLRTRLDEAPPAGKLWPTGIPPLDDLFSGGLPKGAFTEIISRDHHAGSATLLRALLHHAASENQIVALVDGADSLDVAQLGEAALTRLLWVRCRSGEEALRAADLLLRDRNLSLLMLDLINVPEAQVRRISPTTWYRFQRLIEETATVCLVFTPRPLVSPAETRLTIQSHFSLNALDAPEAELLRQLKLKASTAQPVREIEQQKFA